ncbi:MAG: hypothetical protein ACFFG0_43435 [Candidatus Thorarchaeota archaeon]
MDQTSEDIKNILLKDKNLAMILYVLSQIPSYIQELSEELKLPESIINKNIILLKEKKLIRVLNINSIQNGTVISLYPLLLKKIRKIESQSPQNKMKSNLKKIKFYFISNTGLDYLQFVQETLFKTKKDMDKNEFT